MRIVFVFAVIIGATLCAKQAELNCGLSSKQAKISCGSGKYIKIQSAEFGQVTSADTCPITLESQEDVNIKLKTQMEEVCNYKGECNILTQHYTDYTYKYKGDTETAQIAVSYYCEEEANVAKQLWEGFNNERKNNNLQAAEWNEEYVTTARAELDARFSLKGGFSDYYVFNKHDRLDGVANEQKNKVEIRYMMEFVAKLSTAVHPASTAITEWIDSADENDYRNMLYEYDLGGAACDNYGNGWVCVLHAVKLM